VINSFWIFKFGQACNLVQFLFSCDWILLLYTLVLTEYYSTEYLVDFYLICVYFLRNFRKKCWLLFTFDVAYTLIKLQHHLFFNLDMLLSSLYLTYRTYHVLFLLILLILNTDIYYIPSECRSILYSIWIPI